MTDKIKITEEDLFNYVLHPDSLSEGKNEYIFANKDRYVSEIEYYSSFKTSLNPEEQSELHKRIQDKFGETKPFFILIPTWKETKSGNNGLRLAAASATLEKKVDSISLADDKSQFLIRVVKNEDSSLLYLFPKDGTISRYKIEILPSGNVYLLNDTSKPIEIIEETIDRIIISPDGN